MIKKYKSVIFDLDGTLMDTSIGIFKSIDETLKKYSLEFINIDDRKTFIGPPIVTSFKNYFKLSDDKANEMGEYFRNNYKEANIFEAKAYDDLETFLEFLKSKNIKTGVATYKRFDMAERLLEKFDLAKYFTDIQGSNFEATLTKKNILENCINKIGISKEETLFVGDTLGDLESAKVLGVDFCAVTYGFGFKEDLEYVEKNSVLVADKINDLIVCLKES